MQEFITCTICLPEPGEGAEGVAFAIAGMTTAAAGGDEDGPQTALRGEDLVIKGYVTRQELPMLRMTQSVYGTVKEFIVGCCLGQHLLTGD